MFALSCAGPNEGSNRHSGDELIDFEEEEEILCQEGDAVLVDESGAGPKGAAEDEDEDDEDDDYSGSESSSEEDISAVLHPRKPETQPLPKREASPVADAAQQPPAKKKRLDPLPRAPERTSQHDNFVVDRRPPVKLCEMRPEMCIKCAVAIGRLGERLSNAGADASRDGRVICDIVSGSSPTGRCTRCFYSRTACLQPPPDLKPLTDELASVYQEYLALPGYVAAADDFRDVSGRYQEACDRMRINNRNASSAEEMKKSGLIPIMASTSRARTFHAEGGRVVESGLFEDMAAGNAASESAGVHTTLGGGGGALLSVPPQVPAANHGRERPEDPNSLGLDDALDMLGQSVEAMANVARGFLAAAEDFRIAAQRVRSLSRRQE